MLSDEEKILTKKLRYCEQEYEQDGYLSVGKFEAIKEAVNLIEKQSKEIEELKDESKEYQIGFAQGCYEKDLDWKDKIKAKIEEMDIEIQCCEYADDDVEEYKQDMEKEKRRLLRDKEVLQSLLEDKGEYNGRKSI